jgi:hypothetical protein
MQWFDTNQTATPCQWCYACGLDTPARATLESLCDESPYFHGGLAVIEKIVPAVVAVAALLLFKGCCTTARQPTDADGKQYTAKHSYADKAEHRHQRWASVHAPAAAANKEDDVDVALCHEFMLGTRDTIRNMHEGLEQVTNGELQNEGAEATSTMLLQVLTPMVAATLNCSGVYMRMAHIPQRDDTDPTNWFVILLTVVEFAFLHAFAALWLLRLSSPGTMPKGAADRCCRWPTRATLKVRFIQHYQMFIGALSFNGFWFVARSKPLALYVIAKLANHAEILFGRLRAQPTDTTARGGEKQQQQQQQQQQQKQKQQKRSRSQRILALVDKNGDGEVSGIEKFFVGLLGVLGFVVVACLLATIISLIIAFLLFFIALPIIAMYVKLSQVSFVANGYPICDWAPPAAQLAATCSSVVDQAACHEQNQLVGVGTVCAWIETQDVDAAETAMATEAGSVGGADAWTDLLIVEPLGPGGTCQATVDTCWTRTEMMSFITFFVNIFGLSTLLASSRKGLDFMFRGSDGVIDAHEEKAIATAEKLLIQASVRRHGFVKALAHWNAFGQEQVFQIFVKKHDDPTRDAYGQDIEAGAGGSRSSSSSSSSSKSSKSRPLPPVPPSHP